MIIKFVRMIQTLTLYLTLTFPVNSFCSYETNITFYFPCHIYKQFFLNLFCCCCYILFHHRLNMAQAKVLLFNWHPFSISISEVIFLAMFSDDAPKSTVITVGSEILHGDHRRYPQSHPSAVMLNTLECCTTINGL